MLITQKFIDNVGSRSPMARAAMLQAGDKLRIKALKAFLLSIGVCEITFEDIEKLNLPIYDKKYSFTEAILTYVLLDPDTFARFKFLATPATLEIARMRNGVIGIRSEKHTNA